MKKILLSIAVFFALFGCEKSNLNNPENSNITTEGRDWVLINGVRWATRNVGSPRTFVANPEDYGSYYQWNKGTTDFLFYEDYYNSVYANASSWFPTNEPSPAGYRVPTLTEIKSLCDTSYVSTEWTTRNGVNGREFTDRVSGKNIFLPVAGYRYSYDGTLCLAGDLGAYWSSMPNGGNIAYTLGFYSGISGWNTWNGSQRSLGFSVRPVIK